MTDYQVYLMLAPNWSAMCFAFGCADDIRFGIYFIYIRWQVLFCIIHFILLDRLWVLGNAKNTFSWNIPVSVVNVIYGLAILKYFIQSKTPRQIIFCCYYNFGKVFRLHFESWDYLRQWGFEFIVCMSDNSHMVMAIIFMDSTRNKLFL